MKEEIMERLETEYQRMKEIYLENGKTDYEAGILEGLKRALEIVQETK